MSIPELKAKALRHWKKWLPKKYASLQAEGKLDEAAQGAADLAQQEINFLVRDKGYQEHEAEEVALPKFILLPPEPQEDGLDAEQRRETEQRERDYQKNPPVQVG